jgi:hypothetical protein
MILRDSPRLALSAVVLVVLVTACGGGGDSATSRDDGGEVIPVVTSIVGAAPPGEGSTARGGTTISGGETTTTSEMDDDRPFDVPETTTPAPFDATAAADAEEVARAFLGRYWVPEARTAAQVADAIEPYATDALLALFRDPSRADQAVPGAGIGEISVRVTAATPTSATVVGQTTLVDEPDQRVVFRTLDLVLAPDGIWRVESLR